MTSYQKDKVDKEESIQSKIQNRRAVVLRAPLVRARRKFEQRKIQNRNDFRLVQTLHCNVSTDFRLVQTLHCNVSTDFRLLPSAFRLLISFQLTTRNESILVDILDSLTQEIKLLESSSNRFAIDRRSL